MNKAQLQKKELLDELYNLKNNYSKLHNKNCFLQEKINSNPMNYFFCGFGFGIPSIIFGLIKNDSIYIILGGCIILLCVIFGIKDYKKYNSIKNKQYKINCDIDDTCNKIKQIENELKNLKTIKIVLTKYNEQIEADYDIVTRTIENCFYTLLNFLDKEEKLILINYKEHINSYTEECDQLQNIFQDLYIDFEDYDYIQYNKHERIETEKSIVKDIIYEYISCVKGVFQTFINENYGYDGFIKNGQLTRNGIITKNILKKISLLETEYTT